MMVTGFLVMVVLVMALVLLEARPRGRLAYGIGKVLAATWFCVVGAVVVRDFADAPLARPLFLTALALSFLGDVLLIPKGKKTIFLVGLVAFLLAHIMYIPAFVARGVDATAVGIAGIVLIVPAIVVLRWLRPHATGAMWPAVIAYVVVISAMLATATGAVVAGQTSNDGVTPAVLLGAAAFWLSDIFVARQRFVKPGFINRLVGVPLYFFAQLGIIAGFQ